MFTKKDVASYYNSTINHYQKWWNLDNNLSLHYGIWDDTVSSFNQSLLNTNKILMDLSKVSESDHVLDAGCGVGGAALYLAENRNLPVTGITLSEKQLEFSKQNAIKRGLDDKVSFQLMDFTQTSFEDESFDMIWACESVCHTPDRRLFN